MMIIGGYSSPYNDQISEVSECSLSRIGTLPSAAVYPACNTFRMGNPRSEKIWICFYGEKEGGCKRFSSYCIKFLLYFKLYKILIFFSVLTERRSSTNRVQITIMAPILSTKIDLVENQLSRNPKNKVSVIEKKIVENELGKKLVSLKAILDKTEKSVQKICPGLQIYLYNLGKTAKLMMHSRN